MNIPNLWRKTDNQGNQRWFLNDLELTSLQSLNIDYSVDARLATVRMELYAELSSPPDELLTDWALERSLRTYRWREELTEQVKAVLDSLKPDQP